MINFYKNSHISKILISFLIPILFSFLLQACHTYRTGGLVREDILKGSEEFAYHKYEVNLSGKPTLQSPKVQITLNQIPVERVKKQKILAEEKWTNHGGTAAIWWILTAAALAGAIVIASNDENFGKDKKVSGGEWALLLPTVPLVFAAVYSSRSNKYIEKTGVKIDGEIFNDYQNKSTQPFPSKKILVKIDEVEEYYTVDNFGKIEIDLVKDYELNKFEKQTKLNLEIISVGEKIKRNFELNSKDWTVLHLSINRNGIAVETEKDGELVKLGELKAGEEYQILHEGDELIKINFNGEEGYIEKNSGEKFWAVTDYLKK